MADKIKPFVYVDGDAKKTPIDPKTQPAGTHLVLVTPKGRDVHFIAGSTTLADRAKMKQRFDKGNANSAKHIGEEG